MASTLTPRWTGRDVRLATVEDAVRELFAEVYEDSEGPDFRTRVMTHCAWVPLEWLEQARETLAGLAERHPSRSIILVPEPDAEDGLDAEVRLQCYAIEGLDEHVCSEVIELRLRGGRARAPASIVLPLLVADLPAFLRWRGRPPFGTPPFEEMVGVVDRLIVDSTEWPDLPDAYAELAQIFDRTAVSDIAWARTSRWRRQLATLWPDIAEVKRIKVEGTLAQAHLLAGWLRSRLHRRVEVEHVPAERLVGVEVDGRPAPFPPGDRPPSSELLSDELETYGRDRVYEGAVRAAVEG
jgi:hypothetical protein